MTQKKRTKKKPLKLSPRMLLVAAGAVLLLCILLIAGGKKNSVDPLELQAGLNFLEQQEKKKTRSDTADPSEIVCSPDGRTER